MSTHWVMDYETLCNCFIAVFEHYKQEERKVFVVCKQQNDFPEFVTFLQKCVTDGQWHISYNGLGFDAQITQKILNNHKELLKFACQTGHAKHIDIHYNTNATVDVLSMDKSWLWNEFGRVDIAFSIDNVGARFEYERYGAKWDEANAIIDGIHWAQGVDSHNITTQLCFTVNIQNVYYLDELLEWASHKYFGSIYFNMLHSPDHMSIQHMTPAAQELVLNKLKTTFWKSNSYQREIDNVIKFIENGPGSDGSYFLQRMKQTDEYRRQNFMDTHPEIAKAMGYA